MSDLRRFRDDPPEEGEVTPIAKYPTEPIGGQPLSITVQLLVPVEHGGETITEVTLKEPRFDDMQKINNAKPELREQMTFQIVAGLPPSVIKQLYGRDIKAMIRALGEIMGED